MKELCVVHLVRAANGIEPFRRFLESYRANPGGIEHDLLIVFKGFGLPQDMKEHLKLLTPFRYERLDVSDEGFDITAYLTVIRHYSRQYRYFCFLNSFSVILDPDWLRKLYENICKPDVGLVGGTGSWFSHHTDALSWFRNFPVRILSLRQKNKTDIHKEVKNHSDTIRHLRKSVTSVMEWVWFLLLYIIYFDPFPNYHIRTNAFMIAGEFMETLKYPPIKTKFDAYIFESGKQGLTKKILAMGKTVLVVGKDGRGYEKETWHESGTFWQSGQKNLLVSDNPTSDYQYGSPERRIFLSSTAWSVVR